MCACVGVTGGGKGGISISQDEVIIMAGKGSLLTGDRSLNIEQQGLEQVEWQGLELVEWINSKMMKAQIH